MLWNYKMIIIRREEKIEDFLFVLRGHVWVNKTLLFYEGNLSWFES